ncbi:MAG: hypothetical protein IKX87_10305 [Lachnospiraceae bacterium]|nr:hypothetical protein [Lachnospiraceae bacterium]
MESSALLADLRSMPADARLMYLENAEEEDLQQLLEQLLVEIYSDAKKAEEFEVIDKHKGKSADLSTAKWIQILLDI